MLSGNKEGARLFAENAIRQKSQHMNFLRLSSRIDAVASKLNNAVQMNEVSEKMAKITQKLGPTMNAMNTAKVRMLRPPYKPSYPLFPHSGIPELLKHIGIIIVSLVFLFRLQRI